MFSSRTLNFDSSLPQTRNQKPSRSAMNDLKFAFRQLLQNPGFTAVAVLTLAFGIGACTAIFSVVHAVVIKPLPYPQSDQIVGMWRNVGGTHERDSEVRFTGRIQGLERAQQKLRSSFRRFARRCKADG